MREQGSHETSIEHIDRLFRDGLYGDAIGRDEAGGCAPMPANSPTPYRPKSAAAGTPSTAPI